MPLSRRKLLGALTAFIAAPAIVRVASLMPVKAWDDGLLWETPKGNHIPWSGGLTWRNGGPVVEIHILHEDGSRQSIFKPVETDPKTGMIVIPLPPSPIYIPRRLSDADLQAMTA